MIKRLISVFLACSMLLITMLTSLTGCSNAQANKYTVGDWLDNVELGFNMLYYSQAEPYFDNVNADNSYFDTVQIAAEWGVIDPANGIDLDKYVTKEFVAHTLVKAMNFNYDAEVSIADSDDISSLDTVAIAVNEGIFQLDNSGNFKPAVELTKEEADMAMLIAMDKWVNQSYDETYDKSIVKENVVNLGGLPEEKSPVINTDYTVTYSGNTDLFDENGYFVDTTAKTITFTKDTMPTIEVGSPLVLPADDFVPTSYGVIVTNITENADGTVTVTTRNAELMEVYDSLDVQMSDSLDFTEAVFFDNQGNRVQVETIEEPVGLSCNGLGKIVEREGLYRFDGTGHIMPTSTKVKGSVPLGDGIELKFDCSNEKINLTIECKIDDNQKVSFSKAIPKVNIDTKLDIGWEWDWFNSGIKVKTAKAVVSCDDSMGFAYSYTKEVIDYKSDKGDLEKAYKKLQKLYDDLKKKSNGAEKGLSKQLLNIIFPTGCGIDPQLIVRLDLDVEGKITFNIETKTKFGAEYVNGHIRAIHDIDVIKETQFEGKAELTIFLGVGVSALGATAIDLGVSGGAGVKASLKVRREDPVSGLVLEEMALPFGGGALLGFSNEVADVLEGGDLPFMNDENNHTCFDLSVYPIVRLECCTDSSLIGKFFGGFKMTLMDDDTISKTLLHLEASPSAGFAKTDFCTFEENAEVNFGIAEGDSLTLNDSKVLIGVDAETGYLAVKTLPKGYKAADLVVTVEDESIATCVLNDYVPEAEQYKFSPKIELFGKAFEVNDMFYNSRVNQPQDLTTTTGLKDGVTTVTISTSDGAHSAQANIIVGNGGLKGSTADAFVLTEYSLRLAPGDSAQIGLDAAPEGADVSMVTYASKNPEIASVSPSGVVTAGSEIGMTSVVVTLTTEEKTYVAECMVFVANPTA